MSLTTDRNDPRLGHGVDDKPIPQHDTYLVLSDEERSKGFVRPVRYSYKHVGMAKPKYPLRDLTVNELELYGDYGYSKYETYPESEAGLGRFWTQAQLDNKGCGAVTTMNQAIAETYARNPHFYGATYCVNCQRHLPVGKNGEFTWDDTDYRVGT